MDEIIIVTYGYDGEHSNNPNAICLYEIINSLVKENKVYIITTTTIGSKYYEKTEGNITILYIPIKNKVNGKINFKKWEKEVIEIIHKRISIRKTTRLFTISFPFNVHNIGVRLKNKYPYLNWVIYELDPYAYNLVLKFPKILFFYRYILENEVFNKADCIMLTHELYDQYSKNIFSKYIFKCKNIGIPLMKIYNESNAKVDQKTCSAVYIGSFYKRIREPDYMLEILAKVSNAIEGFQMHIIGPSPDSIPFEYMEKYRGKLFIHGRVSQEKVLEALSKADIMINIGNRVNNQLPSKILEYIGMGKPIINFYSIMDDTSNKYLEYYPSALLIKQDHEIADENIKKIINFTVEYNGTRIPKEKLRDLYREDLIDTVTDKITRILSNIKSESQNSRSS